jgi:taurine dioxygenase
MTSAAQANLEVIPTGAALGAEIRGVDLSGPLPAASIEAIKRAWDEHLVLLMRGQQLNEPLLLAFARHFGALDPPGPNPYGRILLPEYPELNVISNVRDTTGQPIGNLGYGEAVWHADMTYVNTPPMGAILYGVEVPEGQGDTYFANMIAAYEALPDDMKRRLEGKRAIHDAAHNSAGMIRQGYEEIDDVTKTPGAQHPLVRTDPATGRKALFLGRRPHAYVLDMAVQESEALLDALWQHASNMRFAWRHQWRPGDVLMWQNLWVLHRRDAFDADARRILLRAQIKGAQPIV